MSKKQMLFPNNQPGFTLVEVLVALAVVAIGLLGLASLQTVGLRNNHSVNLMSQALWLANDITDKIRSNINANTTDPYNQNCTALQCANPQTMAARDLCDWCRTVIRTLGPNATAAVCPDSNPLDNQDCVNANATNPFGVPFMVRITWNDPAQASGSQQLTTFFIR